MSKLALIVIFNLIFLIAFRDVTEASLNRLRQSGVQIDRIMNPMYLARMRLDQRMQQANVAQQHPDLVLRLQV